jgi:hypothetical protein
MRISLLIAPKLMMFAGLLRGGVLVGGMAPPALGLLEGGGDDDINYGVFGSVGRLARAPGNLLFACVQALGHACRRAAPAAVTTFTPKRVSFIKITLIKLTKYLVGNYYT